MTANRKISIVAGVLFIVAAAAAIIGLVLYGPVLANPEYIIYGAADEKSILWGAFFETILVFSVIGTSVTLFPILKKYSQSMAIGCVSFRLLEAAIIVMGILSLLAILTLNHDYSKAMNPDSSSYLIAGKLLLAIHNWSFLFGPNIALGPSTLMTSYLLYKSKLVPRSISALGLIGGPLIFTCGVLVMLGVFPQLSVWGGILAIPVFVYEMSLASWLITKGFRYPVIPHPARMTVRRREPQYV